MAKLMVTPTISVTFADKVHSLAHEGKALSKAYSDLTRSILVFAKSLHGLWEQAKKLDQDAENGPHRQYLMDTITDAIGTDSKTIRSRWLLIGQQSSSLTPYRASLPPLRDNLYEVALAAKDNKPIGRWIEKGDLTPETSVREIRGLRDQKSRSAAKKGTKKKLIKSHKAFPAAVTLCFESYEDALQILTPLLISSEHFIFIGEKTFNNILQELDEADYAKAAEKIR
jgi:hypothetical protein